ncbi:PH domain-containing protein [Amycolatopsis anabasis]|uniref:PH domain-containing protein n=1 Tax=Amycolatopsis anabasis TaxID=1840409 RepID=UPI00131B4E7B|nr:PH domain-containing protein [Amycolatopsis anabasis]
MAEKERYEQPEQPSKARKAVFRIPGTAYIAIVLLVICITPVALGGIPGLQALYLVPLGLIVFVARTRTVATVDGLSVRTVFGKRELPWSALKGLALTPRAKVRAVLSDDTQVALPAVRTRHIPVLSLVSKGLIADPSGLTADIEPEDQPTENHGQPKPQE